MDDKEAQRVREAYKQEFGEDLTEKEASVMLTQLVQLYLHISRQLPPDTSGNTDTLKKYSRFSNGSLMAE